MTYTFFRRHLLSSSLIISACIAAAPNAKATQQTPPSETDSMFETATPSKKEKKKKRKPSRLEKEKWEKRKYSNFTKRRIERGLPADLSKAPPQQLLQDPSLKLSNISSVIDAPEAKQAVNQILYQARTIIPAKLPDTPIQLSDAEINTALAVNTGQILIGTNFLTTVESLDALVFVITHELAHVAYDHFKNEDRRQDFNNIMQVATLVAKGGDRQSAEGSDELVGYMFISDRLVGPNMSKADERIADELAVDILVHQNLSLEGARVILQILELQEEEANQLKKQRCNGMTGLAYHFGASFHKLANNGQDLPAECKGKGFLGLGGIFSSNRSARQRLKDFNKYIETRHPDYPRRPQTELSPAIKKALRAGGILEKNMHANKALKALTKNDLETAAHHALLSYDPKKPAGSKSHIALYSLYKMAGEFKTARHHLTTALKNPNAPVAVYLLELREKIDHAKSIQAKEKRQKINSLIKALKTRGRANTPQARHTSPPNTLSPAVKKAYEQALSFTQEAQTKFGNLPELMAQEFELLNVLGRHQERQEKISKCASDKHNSLINFCKQQIASQHLKKTQAIIRG